MSEVPESPWLKELAASLHDAGIPGADVVAAGFAARASLAYRELTTPAEAVLDIAELAALGPDLAAGVERSPLADVFGPTHRLLVRPSTDPAISFRLRRLGEQGIELTRVLPVLESFGLVVVEVVPLRVGPGASGEPSVHIDDIAVRVESPHGPEASRFVPEIHGPRLVEALEALARGDADVDSLNRLVTVAGLDWRQVMVLRAYLRYRLQYDQSRSWSDLADPLASFPEVARALIGYFQARFDPSLPEADRDPAAQRALCAGQLDLVLQLAQDRVLRGFLGLIDATVRTNYFQPSPANIVLKFDCRAVPDLPMPRPLVETFVHGPRVEGAHLRAGLIARGGIRWSERPTDFRTEVLDLAFAQVKKNAIIVPTGAKGGFVMRASTTVAGAYEEFIDGLLQITDNIVEGQVVHPPNVVALDGPDPYLVVAADKGTAEFSDLANSISQRAGFWLGDAFASGGSHGYDHKAMGITARGAWVAVRRHFRELGLDVQHDPVRVVGVGDMSGDVFGNGMLQSHAIELVAAFDHRHIFLDPDPDTERSYEERARLASRPKSSWADYRRDVISDGGGVWARDVKSVELALPVRRALGVEVPELSPPELISAILAAPVDLIWFGGIGTYIKAPGESDADIGDHANDAVRITSDRVRARVVAEGANLGVTQMARIRYSRRGGRINADFIDNAAGVATSDREVNLKILLSLAIEERRIAADQRDGFLTDAEAEVATEVLRQVDHSVAALNRATLGSAQELDSYESLLQSLESAGRFSRTVEFLPTSDEMEVRRAAGAGLIRPELAVVLAYAKSDLVAQIEGSALVGEPNYLDAVVPYFPRRIREGLGDLIPRHRLYPQLVATNVAGEIVDQLGIVWAHETAAEVGRPLDEVAAAFWAARQITRAGPAWTAVEDSAPHLPAETETFLHAAIGQAVADVARSYLNASSAIDIGALLTRDQDVAAELAAEVPTPARFADLEADAAVKDAVGRVCAAARVADVGPVMTATGRSLGDALALLDQLDPVGGLDGLGQAVRSVLETSPPPSRLTVWQARALLDDIASWRRDAAIGILQGPGLAPWIDQHQAVLTEAAAAAALPRRDRIDPLAAADLTIRRLRRAL
jgi:glutamate dehydrogenase